MLKQQPVTITDIAKKANVTSITVSRVFNHPELVKKVTREKILLIAQELGYVPNVFAQNLKKSNSQIIGIVTDSICNPFYSNSIQTISRIARARGYQIMMFDTDGDECAEQQAIETLISYKANGILLSPVRDDIQYHPDYLKKIIQHKTPLVMIDRAFYHIKLPGVFLNNTKIGLIAGHFLAAQQTQNILIVGGPEYSQITQQRLQGIMQCFNGMSTTLHTVFTNYTFSKINYQAIYQILQSMLDQPFWIVGLNGIITAGMIELVNQLNCGATQVSYFSIDEVPYSVKYGLNIPGVYHDTHYIGEVAANTLFSVIENQSLGTRMISEQVIIDGNLVTYTSNSKYFQEK